MALRPMNGIDLANQKIVNLADPSASTDAANKNYVDAVARGLDWHAHVRVAAASNITITAPGATVNGVTLANGDRILLTAQSTASQNGLWVYNGAASALTRPTDYAAGAVLTNPSITVTATEGTTPAGNIAWTLSTDGTVTVDTTTTAWAQVGGSGTVYTGGNGITVTGASIAATAAPSGGVTVGAGGIALDTTVATRKFSANLGAATAGSAQTVTHNLNTLDVHVVVREVSTGQKVDPDDIATGVNTITVTFAAAITSGQYRVIVFG